MNQDKPKKAPKPQSSQGAETTTGKPKSDAERAAERRDRGKDKTKKKTKGMLNNFMVSSGILVDFHDFFTNYQKISKSLDELFGLPITDWLKGPAGSMAKQKEEWRKKHKKHLVQVPKEKKEKMKTIDKIDLKNVKSLGEWMYKKLGMNPPSIPKEVPKKPKPKPKDTRPGVKPPRYTEAEPEKAKKKVKNPLVRLLMFNLESLKFSQLNSNRAIYEGISILDSETKQPKLYKGDPIFFRKKNGTFEGGFIESFTATTIKFKRLRVSDGVEEIVQTDRESAFMAFHIPGNKQPVEGAKVPSSETKKDDKKGKKKGKGTK